VVADPAASGPEAARLVAAARAARDPAALVAALRAEAWYERLGQRHARALELLHEAARVARRHGLDRRLADVLTSRGAVEHELGRLAAAQRDFDRATALLGPEADPDLVLQRAALHQNAGRSSAAVGLYRAVLAEPGTPALVRAKAANNLGMLEVETGRYAAALASFTAAVAAAGEVGPAAVAIATEGLAWGTVHAGRLVEGLALYETAVERWTAAGLPLGELYAAYADVLADLRLVPEATDTARRALDSLEGQGLQLMAAEAQLRWARLAVLAGRPADAVPVAEAAAGRFARQRRRNWAARARLIAVDARRHAGASRPSDLGVATRATAELERAAMASTAVDAHLVTGRVAAALGRPAAAEWHRAHELSRGAPVLVRVRGRLAAALAARAEDRPDAVLRHARAGLADLAGHQAALPSAELRALASGHGAELGALGLATLVLHGAPTPVLRWMERTRAAALAVVDPVRVAGVEDEVAALRALQVEIRRVRAERQVDPADLLARQAAAEARIRRLTWQRTAPGRPDPARAAPVAELRAELAGRPLVEYDVLAGTVVAVVLGPRRARLVRLGPLEDVRQQLTWLLFGLRRLTRTGVPRAAEAAARRTVDAALAALHERLVAPLRLPPDVPAVVSPVRDLLRVPWAALLDRPTSVVPSAGLWLRSARRPAPGTGRVALVAGPELPGALAEVTALAPLYPDPVVLVPPAAGVTEVVRALDGAELAHLACHGLVRDDNPTFTSLLLADGHLTLHELDQVGTPPHRIVLASCRSGQDVGLEGNEPLGFVGTLLARGTAGLVASTVDVPDLASTPLLRLLHAALPGAGTLAAALHEARTALDPTDPAAYVARTAFTAYGAA
jgi:tetratricopeptide (TPR) repeat protein